MKIVKINDPVYSAEIRVIVNCTQDELKGYLKRSLEYDYEIDTEFCGNYMQLSNGTYNVDIVWVKTFDWTINDQAILNHELLHCALSILDRCLVPLGSGPESEPLAYYHEFLFRETWNKLKPKKKRKGK